MPFFKVEIEKTLTDHVIVEADSLRDAERDARELTSDLDWEDSSTSFYGSAFTDDVENFEYWTGGEHGHWEST